MARVKVARPPVAMREEILRRLKEGQELRFVLHGGGRYRFNGDWATANRPAVEALLKEKLLRMCGSVYVLTTPEAEAKRRADRAAEHAAWEEVAKTNKENRLRLWANRLLNCRGDMPLFIETLEQIIERSGFIEMTQPVDERD